MGVATAPLTHTEPPGLSFCTVQGPYACRVQEMRVQRPFMAPRGDDSPQVLVLFLKLLQAPEGTEQPLCSGQASRRIQDHGL